MCPDNSLESQRASREVGVVPCRVEASAHGPGRPNRGFLVDRVPNGLAHEWQAGPHVMNFVKHQIRMDHAEIELAPEPPRPRSPNAPSPNPRYSSPASVWRGSVRPRPSARRLTHPELLRGDPPDTGSFPSLVQRKRMTTRNLQQAPACGRPSASVLRSSWGASFSSGHSHNERRPLSSSASILSAVGVWFEAADVGNPTRPLIHSGDQAGTSN